MTKFKEMSFQDARDIRAFIVAVCPNGHKARNMSKDAMNKLTHWISQAQQPVYESHTGNYLGYDKLDCLNFILTPEQRSGFDRAFALCLDYVEVLLHDDNFKHGAMYNQLFVAGK